MGDSIITLTNIVKCYGKHEVLKGVNLDIKKGRIYGLVGKNGAGKSTIFKVILGLSDYTSGSLRVGAEGDTPDEGRRKIGFLIGNNYYDKMNGRDNLMFYARLKGIKNPKQEVERVLKIVELDNVKTKVMGYSLGMKQRLGIANALLGTPEVLILDEPTNGLDPQGIADIRHLVQSLNKEYGMTVIVSSHILGELQHTAHEFAILNEGRIVRLLTEEDMKNTGGRVSINVDDLDKARKALEDAGVQAEVEEQVTKSLEDIYFEMIGGKKDA